MFSLAREAASPHRLQRWCGALCPARISPRQFVRPYHRRHSQVSVLSTATKLRCQHGREVLATLRCMQQQWALPLLSHILAMHLRSRSTCRGLQKFSQAYAGTHQKLCQASTASSCGLSRKHGSCLRLRLALCLTAYAHMARRMQATRQRTMYAACTLSLFVKRLRTH